MKRMDLLLFTDSYNLFYARFCPSPVPVYVLWFPDRILACVGRMEENFLASILHRLNLLLLLGECKFGDERACSLCAAILVVEGTDDSIVVNLEISQIIFGLIEIIIKLYLLCDIYKKFLLTFSTTAQIQAYTQLYKKKRIIEIQIIIKILIMVSAIQILVLMGFFEVELIILCYKAILLILVDYSTSGLNLRGANNLRFLFFDIRCNQFLNCKRFNF